MELPQNYSVTARVSPESHVRLSAENLTDLESAAPKEFGGPGDRWSPEDLLVAAVADCFVLSFRAIAAASKFEWVDLKCDVVGKLDKVDRAVQFVELAVKASLTIPPGTDPTRAHRLLEKAEQSCFITNSLKASVHLETMIQ